MAFENFLCDSLSKSLPRIFAKRDILSSNGFLSFHILPLVCDEKDTRQHRNCIIFKVNKS